MSQHTPGPWVVHHDADCKEIEITAEDGRIIAFMFGNQPQDIADAHLIAAAPDLLDAAEAALARVNYLAIVIGKKDVFLALQNKLRAAIAKARGEA
jgi:hypothetical protein